MKALLQTLVLVLTASVAWAAHPFHVEDMHALSRVGEPKISPDGEWVAFTVTRSDVAKNKSVTNIWTVPAAGGVPTQMTFAEAGRNTDIRWSPDSRWLYFVSTRVDDTRQIFRLSPAGGEAKQISTVPIGVDSYVLSPDGATIVFTASAFAGCADMACNERAAKALKDNPVKSRVITSIPFRRWDEWNNGRHNHIFVMPSDGGASRDLTPGDVDSPIWTEDGSEEIAVAPDATEICFSRYTDNEALTG